MSRWSIIAISLLAIFLSSIGFKVQQNALAQSATRFSQLGMEFPKVRPSVNEKVSSWRVQTGEATGRSGFSVFKPARWWSFHLRASNGFLAIVHVIGRKTAVLELLSREARVEYRGRAWARGHRIRASFGPLGRVAMKFIPAESPHPTTEPQGDCRGKDALIQGGTFHGSFRFRGEKSFSVVRSSRIRGMSVRSFREVCKGMNAATGNDRPIEPILVARSRANRRFVEVQTYFDGNQSSFASNLLEVRHGLRIIRSLGQLGQGGDVSFDAEDAITIHPPSPFSDSAQFRPVRGSRGDWRGGLFGEFPGLGQVSLAGPSFTAWRIKAKG